MSQNAAQIRKQLINLERDERALQRLHVSFTGFLFILRFLFAFQKLNHDVKGKEYIVFIFLFIDLLLP